MQISFYTLLYVELSESRQVNRTKKISGEERLLLYLKNCQTLNHSLSLNELGTLTVLTNKAELLQSICDKHRLSFDIQEISFSLAVPKGIGFYSAHFKIDAYRYLGSLAETYSFLLDNDVVCSNKMPESVMELIHMNAALYYSLPICRVQKHNIILMKEISPEVITGRWVGGEFVAGNADFFSDLYRTIMTFANRYFNLIDSVFHQGDEMLTSIAMEKLQLEHKHLLIDGGPIGLMYRYNPYHEARQIEVYKSWFYHLPCDKTFLATSAASKTKSNADFFHLYRRHYFSAMVQAKRLYKWIKNLKNPEDLAL